MQRAAVLVGKLVRLVLSVFVGIVGAFISLISFCIAQLGMIITTTGDFIGQLVTFLPNPRNGGASTKTVGWARDVSLPARPIAAAPFTRDMPAASFYEPPPPEETAAMDAAAMRGAVPPNWKYSLGSWDGRGAPPTGESVQEIGQRLAIEQMLQRSSSAASVARKVEGSRPTPIDTRQAEAAAKAMQNARAARMEEFSKKANQKQPPVDLRKGYVSGKSGASPAPAKAAPVAAPVAAPEEASAPPSPPSAPLRQSASGVDYYSMRTATVGTSAASPTPAPTKPQYIPNRNNPKLDKSLAQRMRGSSSPSSPPASSPPASSPPAAPPSASPAAPPAVPPSSPAFNPYLPKSASNIFNNGGEGKSE